jgi:hypothetical protein
MYTRENLLEIAEEVREALKERREQLALSFVEDKHIYYMRTLDGNITSKFKSVSRIVKQFHPPFDSEGLSLKVAGGDPEKQKEILAEWKQAGKESVNLGSRVHFELEKMIIEQYGNYKEVRQPIFNINEEQKLRSDNMIKAGKDFLDKMHERGAVLLDTEAVLGDPELMYVGQPDNAWIMLNKAKTDFGIVVTDHKSNKPKNFKEMPYHGNMYPPFQHYKDFALSHYYTQIPLYGRLIMKMLSESKFSDKKFLGGVIALMKDDATYEEFRVPKDIVQTVFSMDLTPYVV